MTLFYGYSSDPEKRAGLVLNIWVLQEDSANNQSKVAWVIDYFDNSSRYGGNGTSAWSATAAGNTYSGSVSFDFTGNSYSQIRILDNSAGTWLSHNTDGTQSVSVSGTVAANSPVGATTVSGTLPLTDYVRLPAAPNAPTLTRASNGSTISMSTNTPTSPLTVTNFYFRYSTDNLNWNSVAYTGNSTPSISSWVVPSSTVGYYISAQAYSSEGWSAASASSFVAGIPSAPASIATSRTARNVTVTITASPSNGGATISGYKVQYSSDGGTTWSTAQDISSLSYTYTGLTPALTYTFRAYSTNSTGNSAYATSYGVFVPASGKRFDGTSWQPMTTAKRFDGTAWNDIATGARNDGSNWVYLS